MLALLRGNLMQVLRRLILCLILSGFAILVAAQSGEVVPNENLVAEGVPKIPTSLAETVERYSNFRAANLTNWHPTRREMLIATRFADVSEIHRVQMPGGARSQLTFYPDAVTNAQYEPTQGNYFVFSKDVGGGEFYQLYRDDLDTGEVTLLTDAENGEKTLLTPKGGEKISYSGGRFSKDGKGIYTTTDKESEFHRLAYIDLSSRQHTYLSTAIPWDVEEFDLSEDGQKIAFVTNEDGFGILHIYDIASKVDKPVTDLPRGVIDDVRWRRHNHEVGFNLSSARSPWDVYSLDTDTGKVERWTFSETGGLNTARLPEPELIHWKSWDGRTISGFLYRPPAKFSGPRPVMILIHGGPEGQSRPDFLASNNYYLNELGIALVWPNVRGSTGYGKTFLALDNGILRDGSYKDINSLLDWLGQQSGLDAKRVLVMGGSYGGFMTLAVATNYNDRICCSVDIVGPSNLVTFLEHTSGYRQDLRRVEYGDERDPKVRAYLESIAPANKAKNITKPLFVIAGKNDPRVPASESEQMAEVVRKNNTPVWYLLAKDEGHGFHKKKNRDFQFYATVMFVKEYLLK